MNKAVAFLACISFLGVSRAEPVVQEEAAIAIARATFPDAFGSKSEDVRAFYLNASSEWAVVSCVSSNLKILDSDDLKIISGSALVKVSSARARVNSQVKNSGHENSSVALDALRTHLKAAAYPIYAILSQKSDRWFIYSCGRSRGNIVVSGDSYAELEVKSGAVLNASYIK